MHLHRCARRCCCARRARAEVSTALGLCHAAGQPVITHGGLTGLVHGADTTETDVVLSLERMRKIESIDPVQRVALVEAGVTLQQLQEAADEQGLAFPLDLGARGTPLWAARVDQRRRQPRAALWHDPRDGAGPGGGAGRRHGDSGDEPADQEQFGLRPEADIYRRRGHAWRDHPARAAAAREARAPGRRPSPRLPASMRWSRCSSTWIARSGGGLSAFEVMWPEFYELVTTPPSKGRAPVPHGSPFYVLIESWAATRRRCRAIPGRVREGGGRRTGHRRRGREVAGRSRCDLGAARRCSADGALGPAVRASTCRCPSRTCRPTSSA